MSWREAIDWTAPAAELHDVLVEHFCTVNEDYEEWRDEFQEANEFADMMIERYAL